MIVDARLRPPIERFADIHATARLMAAEARAAGDSDLVDCRSLVSGDLAHCLEEMQQAGVDLALVPARVRRAGVGEAHNAGLAEFVASDARFLGYGGPNLDSDDPAAELQHLIGTLGLKGIALEPGHWSTPLKGDAPPLLKVYDWCQQAQVPVILMAGGNAGPDITYSDPAIVDRIAVQFPKLTVVVTHGGWPWVVPAISVAMRRPNVYLAPDMYMYGFPGCSEFVEAGNAKLRDKLIFASGYPFVSIGAAVAWVQRHFRPEVLPGILANNAIRAFNLNVPAAS